MTPDLFIDCKGTAQLRRCRKRKKHSDHEQKNRGVHSPSVITISVHNSSLPGISEHVSWFQLISPKERIRFHAFFAFQLHFMEHEYLLAACYLDSSFVSGYHSSRCFLCLFFQNRALPDLQCFSIDKGKSAWLWIKASYQTLQFFRIFAEIQKPHFFGDHGSIWCWTLLRLFLAGCSSVKNGR